MQALKAMDVQVDRPRMEAEHDGREPDVDDEPTLGAHETPEGACQWLTSGCVFEDEPSLGSVAQLDQRQWANHHQSFVGASFDYEAKHDRRKPDHETKGLEDLEAEEAW